MITIVSPGTIGITESRNATAKMMRRNHQFAEKSANQSIASLSASLASEKMLAMTAASIAAPYDPPVGSRQGRRLRADDQMIGAGATDGCSPRIAVLMPFTKIDSQDTYSS